MSDSKGAAIDELLIAFANDVVGLAEGKKFRVAAPRKAILAILAQEVKQTQTNAVAWTIGVIDNMHYNSEPALDSTYKGLKNTIRDRYLAETGVDPAPSYPIKAGLV